MKDFKPNLIPNNGDGIDLLPIIERNGGISEYMVSPKKDGVRLLLKDGKVLSRALKEPNSVHVLERFTPLATLCNELGIIMEGEFYAHGMSFNEIFRFYSNTDCTRPKSIKEGEFPSRSIEWLTTFHDDLKFWWFDGIVIDQPDLSYEERLYEITQLLLPFRSDWKKVMELPIIIAVHTERELKLTYEVMLDEGYEGLVLTHRKHLYKFGRNTIKEGTLLKMKDDKDKERKDVTVSVPCICMQTTTVLEGDKEEEEIENG